jgi:hypothetical protein
VRGSALEEARAIIERLGRPAKSKVIVSLGDEASLDETTTEEAAFEEMLAEEEAVPTPTPRRSTN